MPLANRHPTQDTLTALVRGHAIRDRLSDLTAHLEACPECLARLEALRTDADDLVVRLRAEATATLNLRPPPQAAGLPAVPGYRLGRELGRGGVGVVYEAESLSLGRRVAVKLLRDGGRAKPEVLARFRAEAVALARLAHPNVVQVYDAGVADGVPFLALEYVGGGTLATAAPLAPREAARTLAAVAQGVQAAHEAGIVHRDLKPANVLVDAAGVPKVSDFGLAKLSESAATGTIAGTIAGTPAYMAPEQAAGTALPGPSMDVYALGAVLYELLAGRAPFVGDTVLGVLQQVRDREPPPLPQGVPADLATICRRCLRKEPAGRYASAAALADDLARFLAGQPILARPVGPTEWAVKWARRNPALSLTAAALAAAVLAGLAGMWVQTGRAEQARAAADREGEKSQNTAAEQALDQGILLCEQGQVAAGLALFSRAGRLSAGTDGRLDFAVAANDRAWQPYLRPAHRTPLFGSPVAAAEFSPDGRTLLTANWGKPDLPGRVRLWHPDDLTTPRLVVEHPGPIRTAAYHPAGRAFVTGGLDGTVRVWDADTGAPLGGPLTHLGPVTALAFSPTGDRLAVAAVSVWPHAPGATAEVRVWDWAARKTVFPPARTPFLGCGLAWAPDGTAVAVAGVADFDRPVGHTGAMAILAAATGATRPAAFAQNEPLRTVAWHPDGWLATGGDDGVVRFWEADGRRRPGLLSHPMRVNRIRFAAAGKVLVAACGKHHPDTTSDGPGEVQCWELATQEKLSPPLAETRYSVCNKMNDVTISADGRRLAVAGENGHAWVTDLPLPPAAVAVAPLARIAEFACFSPDGGLLALMVSADPIDGDPVHRPTDVTLLDGRTLARRADLKLPGRRELGFHPAGHSLLAVGKPGYDVGLTVWDAATGAVRPLPAGLSGVVDWAAWSPDGAELWAADAAGRLTRWDAPTLAPVGDPLAVGRVVSYWEPNPVVVGVAAGRAAVWFPREGKRVELGLPAVAVERMHAYVAAGGEVVLTASHLPGDQMNIWSWDARTGRPLAGPLACRPSWLSTLADDRVVALATYADSKTVYQLRDARTLVPLSPAVMHNQRGDFHPAGQFVATGSGVLDERLRLVSFTGRTIGPPVPHPDRTYVVRFNPDGTRLLTSGADKTVRLWAVP